MWSSAMASSSPVLTPGRTAAFTAAIAPAVTRPEARMSSISCGVLIWIMRPLHFASSGTRERIPDVICCPAFRSRRSGPVRLLGGRLPGVRGPQRPQGPVGDLVDLADRVDAGEQALGLVEPRQWGRLFPVDLEPVPHGLGLVVLALHHLAVDE